MLSLLVLLAGCAGDAGQKAKATSGATVTISNDAPEDEAGTIVGTVSDDEQRPIAGAQVALLGGDLAATAQTDESGGFALQGVPPGEHVVGAQKIGYESNSAKVVVAAGDTEDVQVILKPIIDLDEVYYELVIGKGYIACGVHALNVGVTTVNICPWDANHKPRYEFLAKQAGLKGVMQEIVWQTEGPLNAPEMEVRLEYKLTCETLCIAERTFKATVGTSPVRQYIPLDNQGLTDSELPLVSGTFVDGGQEPVIAYQQPVDHFLTKFYGQHGELETFTALPPA